jgi:hypothetical protein
MNVAKRGRSWLGVDRQIRRFSKGVDRDNLAHQGFNRIDKMLIIPRYTFFSRSPTVKNSGVKRTNKDKSAKKRLLLVSGASL